MKLVLKNVTVNGRRTSMRLEPFVWDSLKEICKREGVTLAEMLSRIEGMVEANLTGGVRVFVAAYYRQASTEEGHQRAGHGSGNPLAGWPVSALAIEGAELETA